MRLCPICSNKKSKILFVQNYVFPKLSYNIASCNNCGFVFANNAFSQKYYSRYYKKMSKYEIERDYLLHNKYLRIIKKFAKKSDKILDVGCSTGHLLYLLKKSGYKNLYGIDPSETCQNIAKKSFNLNISASDLFSFQSKKKYDFIILSMVLEHLFSINQAIKKIMSLLSNEGYVFISIPNAANFYFDFKEPFGEFSVEHINFFSSSYLHYLMRDADCSFFESDNENINSVWKIKESLRKAICKYIAISNSRLNKIKKIIDKCPQRIVVWGAGSLTQRLLNTTALSSKVLRFVDIDKKLIGTKLMGTEIISPEDVINYNEPILISSFRFKDEILRFIELNHFKNKIITFD